MVAVYSRLLQAAVAPNAQPIGEFMPEQSRITQALARFDAALARFERAGGGRVQPDSELHAEISRLKGENREAGRRIDSAMAKIRSALGG